MSRDWETEIQDPQERKVFHALANQSWDFRTIDGLAQETSLAAKTVKDILDQRRELVRRSPVPGPNGEDLYTLKEPSMRERLSVLRAAAAKTSS